MIPRSTSSSAAIRIPSDALSSPYIYDNCGAYQFRGLNRTPDLSIYQRRQYMIEQPQAEPKRTLQAKEIGAKKREEYEGMIYKNSQLANRYKEGSETRWSGHGARHKDKDASNKENENKGNYIETSQDRWKGNKELMLEMGSQKAQGSNFKHIETTQKKELMRSVTGDSQAKAAHSSTRNNPVLTRNEGSESRDRRIGVSSSSQSVRPVSTDTGKQTEAIQSSKQSIKKQIASLQSDICDSIRNLENLREAISTSNQSRKAGAPNFFNDPKPEDSYAICSQTPSNHKTGSRHRKDEAAAAMSPSALIMKDAKTREKYNWDKESNGYIRKSVEKVSDIIRDLNVRSSAKEPQVPISLRSSGTYEDQRKMTHQKTLSGGFAAKSTTEQNNLSQSRHFESSKTKESVEKIGHLEKQANEKTTSREQHQGTNQKPARSLDRAASNRFHNEEPSPKNSMKSQGHFSKNQNDQSKIKGNMILIQENFTSKQIEKETKKLCKEPQSLSHSQTGRKSDFTKSPFVSAGDPSFIEPKRRAGTDQSEKKYTGNRNLFNEDKNHFEEFKNLDVKLSPKEEHAKKIASQKERIPVPISHPKQDERSKKSSNTREENQRNKGDACAREYGVSSVSKSNVYSRLLGPPNGSYTRSRGKDDQSKSTSFETNNSSLSLGNMQKGGCFVGSPKGFVKISGKTEYCSPQQQNALQNQKMRSQQSISLAISASNTPKSVSNSAQASHSFSFKSGEDPKKHPEQKNGRPGPQKMPSNSFDTNSNPLGAFVTQVPQAFESPQPKPPTNEGLKRKNELVGGKIPPTASGNILAEHELMRNFNSPKAVNGQKVAVSPNSPHQHCLYNERAGRVKETGKGNQNYNQDEMFDSFAMYMNEKIPFYTWMFNITNRSLMSIGLRDHKALLLQIMQGIKYMKNTNDCHSGQIEQKKVFLQKANEHKNRKSIIFDLDETLIHCNDSSEKPADVCLPILFPSGQLVKAGINIRPFAVECLRELSHHFEIIVFTASHKCYANVVLDHLDPKGEMIHHRIFRDNCITTPEGVFVKDLRILANRNLSDVVLVDNASYSFGYQLNNGIPILPFYDDKTDGELKLLVGFLKSLALEPDVRPVIQKTFKMREFLAQDTPEAVLKSISL